MRVLEGQSLFDIAIQWCGSAEAAFDLAMLNSVSLTDEPTQIDAVPAVVNADIAAYFLSKGICPATLPGIIPDLIATPIDSYISYEGILQSDEVIVLDGQSFFDLATIYCGSPELAYEFAALNQMSATDDPEPGRQLKKPVVNSNQIVAYYANKALKPATGYTKNNELPIDDGIGYWAVEIDFIVS